MELTHKDVQDIIKIIDSAEHLNEIELTLGGLQLHVVRNDASVAAAPRTARAMHALAPNRAQTAPVETVTVPALAPSADDTVSEGIVAIRAPMLGTFYRAPAPGEKPFVEVGQRVGPDDTVCTIEVMKLFNSIRAGVDGTVVGILAENGSMVEFDQVLIHVAPGR